MNNSSCCSKCFGTRRCGSYHLYVIELDYQLIYNRKFMSKNPLHKNDMDCLYVGVTSHTCECRFKQHQIHAKKETDGYFCLCDNKEIFRNFVRSGGHTHGSYYPGVYGMRLRPDLFYKYNPIKNKEKAFAMETKLADKLRSFGFAVWQH
jgi:hypothetical protein